MAKERRSPIRQAHRDSAEFEIEEGTLDPREAVRTIDERLPASIGLVIGAGHCFGFSVLEMKKERPFHVWVTSFGCIGQTIPSVIGVGVGLGDQPVVHIAGDGGAFCAGGFTCPCAGTCPCGNGVSPADAPLRGRWHAPRPRRTAPRRAQASLVDLRYRSDDETASDRKSTRLNSSHRT